MSVELTPLLAAPLTVQLHVLLGVGTVLVGALRLIHPDNDGLDQRLGWSFLALLLLTSVSALFIPTREGSPNLMGFTPMHAFAALAFAGAGAAVVAARQGDRLRWRKIVTATFTGVVLMGGLFEVLPGRMLNSVLAGG